MPTAYDGGNDRLSVPVVAGVETTEYLSMKATLQNGAVVRSAPFAVYSKNLSGFPLAAVALLDAQGAATGAYGPSTDPEGVFLGQTGFAAADKWWTENVPAGATVTPLAGGSFTLAIAGGMAVGSYTFGVVRWTASTSAIVRTTKAFTVT